MPQKIKLSLTKLVALLDKKSFTIVSCYCENEEVRFMEVQSPFYQKTFFIYIPTKYKLLTNGEYKNLKIYLKTINDERQVDYIAEIKGNLHCDILAISSNSMCLCLDKGEILHYSFNVQGESERSDNVKLEETKIDKLIKVSEETIENTIVKKSFNSKNLKKIKGSSEKNQGDKVELVFEDDDGSPIDYPIQEIMEREVQDTEPAGSGEKLNNISYENLVPFGIERADLHIGIIYFSIDIGSFYKEIATVEDTIVKTYESINENENIARDLKIQEIDELSKTIISNMERRRDKYMSEYKESKNQLITLKNILLKADNISSVKDHSSKTNIEKIQIQTRAVIQELNMKMLKNREDFDNILNIYQTTLESIADIN